MRSLSMKLKVLVVAAVWLAEIEAVRSRLGGGY